MIHTERREKTGKLTPFGWGLSFIFLVFAIIGGLVKEPCAVGLSVAALLGVQLTER